MASLDALAPFMDEGHREALRVLREYGGPEDVKKLDLMQPSVNDPQVTCVYQGVLIGALARLYEQQVRPRPRGRPRGARRSQGSQ